MGLLFSRTEKTNEGGIKLTEVNEINKIQNYRKLIYKRNDNKTNILEYQTKYKNRILISKNSNHLRSDSENYNYNSKNIKRKQKHLLLAYKLNKRPYISLMLCSSYVQFETNNDFENMKYQNFQDIGKGIIEHSKKKFLESTDDFIFECKILNIILTENQLKILGKPKVLKYEPGSFIFEHKDQFGDYTCLYFPKGMKFTGGELVFYDSQYESNINPKGKVILNLSNLEDDVLIIFSSSTSHEVYPIKSGVRYCVKLNLIKDPNEDHSILELLGLQGFIEYKKQPIEEHLLD